MDNTVERFISINDLFVDKFTIAGISKSTLPANPTTPTLYVITVYLQTTHLINIPYINEDDRNKAFDELKCELTKN